MKKKDWIAQVFSGLEDLDLPKELENIKQIKKLKLKAIIKRKIKERVFEDWKLEKHSNVKQIEYNSFELQKYLKSCEIKITKEEAQEIFKLRTRTSDVKANYKGKYENLECFACENDEETQKYIIIKCKILNENCEQSIPEYEEIYTGNVKTKMIIVKRFLENMKLKEKWKNGLD